MPAKVIIQHVCQHFNIQKDDLSGCCRKKKFAKPRHIAIALSYRYSGNSYASVGRMFGGRNHTTIFNSTKVAAANYPEEMAEIEQKLFSMKVAAE
jgi:chromosomal replication initiator protein